MKSLIQCETDVSQLTAHPTDTHRSVNVLMQTPSWTMMKRCWCKKKIKKKLQTKKSIYSCGNVITVTTLCTFVIAISRMCLCVCYCVCTTTPNAQCTIKNQIRHRCLYTLCCIHFATNRSTARIRWGQRSTTEQRSVHTHTHHITYWPNMIWSSNPLL